MATSVFCVMDCVVYNLITQTDVYYAVRTAFLIVIQVKVSLWE